MTTQGNRSKAVEDLRQKAEALARERAARAPEERAALSPEEISKTLHELQVYQIQLEMQNEELRTAQAEIEAGRARYVDLYDLAPVGYCTLSEQGLILEANLTAARLLGTARGALVKQPIFRFILKEDQDIFYLLRKQLFETGEPQECELRLVKPDGASCWAHLTATAAQAEGGGPFCRVALSDITHRKQAERALQESEGHLRSTLDGLSAHITVLDERGEIILTNQAYRDFGERNGVEPDAVSEGTNYLAVCDTASGEHSQEAAPFAEGIRDVLSGKLPAFELEYPCHSPEEKRWFVGRVTPAQGDGPRRVVIAHENISERKQAEEAQREILQRLDYALQGGRLGMWDWNPQDGVVVYNDLWAQMLEYRPDEVEHTVEFFKQHVHPEDLAAVLDRLTGHIEGRLQVYESEHRLRTRSGRWLWVLDRGEVAERDKDGRPMRVTGIIADITERKRAEEALARQQRSIELFSRIANVFLISSRNEVFADVLNVLLKALDSRFGYFGYIDEAGDLVCPSMTRDVWDQCQIADKSVVFPRSAWGGLWGRSLMEKQTLIANETLRIPEGHVALENALATPIVHHDELIGQFVVADKAGGYDKDDRDLLESAAAQTAPILFAIQEEARQRKAHEKMEEQMRQAQKMESVGRLAGGVAHDFNNMLGVILGHADLILEQIDPGQPFHADLTEIKKAGERSAGLTRQLLAFARKQTVAPKVIDINKTLEGMLKMLHRLIGEDIDVAWIPGEKVWPVNMDPAQIDQILANLCVNARDAIEGVGKVTIETDKVSFDEDYCAAHLGFVPGDYVMLAVSDNGCGMDAETVSYLFEPFFSTKELGKGTGLGLATVYGLVKQNNGFINVYSEPGQGTTFRIYLPRHAAKAAETKKPKPKAAERGSETILLVEDEPAILRMATLMLERTGYTVLAAGTPGEAIALAREHAGQIHLLMTDVIMPEMNGRDLAKNLLSIYPDMRRLFMSGYTANVIAHHGVLDQGVNFIQKPFSKGDLTLKVREVLDQ